MTECKAQRENVLGIPVSSTAFDAVQACTHALENRGSMLVSFVNPHSCFLAERYPDYLPRLNELDWVLCDGIGMVKAAAKINKLKIPRAAFDLTSLAAPVLNWATQSRVPVVLVGGAPGVSEKAADRFTELVPGICITATYSGYDSDPQAACDFLAGNSGTMLICGMGAPRQEAFLLKCRAAGWVGIGFTCGGFFDQVGKRVDYFPPWVNRLNLRFMYRLMKEPKRLWRRYLVEYQVFMKRYLRERLRP